MKRISAFIYSVISYFTFIGTFLYLVFFLGDMLVPKTVNSGDGAAALTAVLINLGLIGLFGVQHTVMARKSFKDRWTQIIPNPIERSTYVLFSSLAVIILMLFWQPLPGVIWDVETGWASMLLEWGFWLGWTIVFLSTWMIDHFNLFGLKQTWNYMKHHEMDHPGFMEPGFYKYVRHPLMTGFLIAFWSTPEMSTGHLIFSAGMTLYILVGVYFEEKAMMKRFGDKYGDYRERVPKFFPFFRKSEA
ncbi:methanethiol S-methyltransferase [Rhodohalobacter mucosus]|uniref:methanethiol S-methyltransferase n=1 Tax=Rhodohalobacter mucosus TaxID=2079485 RepID=A0A316TW24_9BACT|nr:methanethiol S-methyltransferase [Rhodohalobacter mucosus]PWN08138.1 hypothetical protein DDZ15_00445 [Rhodohalobacter mucosus]